MAAERQRWSGRINASSTTEDGPRRCQKPGADIGAETTVEQWMAVMGGTGIPRNLRVNAVMSCGGEDQSRLGKRRRSISMGDGLTQNTTSDRVRAVLGYDFFSLLRGKMMEHNDEFQRQARELNRLLDVQKTQAYSRTAAERCTSPPPPFHTMHRPSPGMSASDKFEENSDEPGNARARLLNPDAPKDSSLKCQSQAVSDDRPLTLQEAVFLQLGPSADYRRIVRSDGPALSVSDYQKVVLHQQLLLEQFQKHFYQSMGSSSSGNALSFPKLSMTSLPPSPHSNTFPGSDTFDVDGLSPAGQRKKNALPRIGQSKREIAAGAIDSLEDRIERHRALVDTLVDKEMSQGPNSASTINISQNRGIYRTRSGSSENSETLPATWSSSETAPMSSPAPSPSSQGAVIKPKAIKISDCWSRDELIARKVATTRM